jgi:AmiR/NasT family two-component response regulator
MMEALLGIVLLIGLGVTIWQLVSGLNEKNQRLKDDLDIVVQRCENLTRLVGDLQDEIVKMESRQQLVEK